MLKLGVVFTVLVSTLVSTTALQADQQDPFERLISASAMTCSFTVGNVAEWKDSKFHVESAGQMASMFRSIDVKARKAELVGNKGNSEVFVIPSASGITFLEQTAMGNLSITTVFPVECGGPNQLCAVLSRHMLLFGPFPSQFYGTCLLQP